MTPSIVPPIGAPGRSPPRFALPLPSLAQRRGKHPALITPTASLAYAELTARADDLAGRLARLGVVPGDRVAVRVVDGAFFATVVHAAARLDAILVPLNTRLAPAEIAWQVADAAPRVLIDGEGMDGVGGKLPGIAIDPDRLLAIAPFDVRLASESLLDAPRTIVYTSGTSGRPKGAVLTFGNHLWNALGSALRLGALPGDRWLAPLPLFHVGGLAILWRAAFSGATVVLPGRFEPATIADSLAADGITLVSLVPTMLARVLDAWGDRPAPPALRAVLVGGGPVAPDLVRRALGLGFPVAVTYGLTEAASQVATAWPGTGPDDSGRLGAPPLPFTEVRVVEADGREVPTETDGEILVRGPTVMAGYWNQPEASAAALEGGWLHTGDIGRLDAAGNLHLSGRREDLIVTGGENVYPAEIEALLAGHPAVADCCVVGVPDAEWGERVVAVVVAAEVGPASHPRDRDPACNCRDRDIDRDDLLAFLRARLAGYKVPRHCIFVDALPRTASGKVRRAEVREMVLTAGGESIPNP